MDLLDRVKVLQKSGYREQWAIYCDQFGNGTRDPNRHNETFLAGFLNYIQGGGAPTGAYSSASTMPNGVTYNSAPMNRMSEKDFLVNEVKALQRQGLRVDWASYCDAYGSGVRDPSRQDPMFCKRFIDACRQGTLAQLYVDMQKQSFGYTMPPEVFNSYQVTSCPIATLQKQTQGFPTINQGMDDRNTMFSVNGMNGYHNENINKNTFNANGGDAYTGGNGYQRGPLGPVNNMNGVPPRPDLVQQVKELQRSGYRDVWARFCESVGNKTLDPARYDSAFIMSFCQIVQSGSVQGVQDNTIIRPVWNNMGVTAGPPQMPYGIVPMQGGPMNRTNNNYFATQAPMGGFIPTINEKDFATGEGAPLVDKVKNLQRYGYQQDWVLYCDQYGDRVRDPSRHTEDFLRQFIFNPSGPWSPQKVAMLEDQNNHNNNGIDNHMNNQNNNNGMLEMPGVLGNAMPQQYNMENEVNNMPMQGSYSCKLEIPQSPIGMSSPTQCENGAA